MRLVDRCDVDLKLLKFTKGGSALEPFASQLKFREPPMQRSFFARRIFTTLSAEKAYRIRKRRFYVVEVTFQISG